MHPHSTHDDDDIVRWQITSPLHHTPWPELTQIEIASFIQIPGFQVIGLPGQEVMEARERVRAAIEASGFEFPRRKVLIHLSPASVQKRGAGLDLGIALAVLCHDRETQAPNETDSPAPPRKLCLTWGELSLDGTIHPCGQSARALLAAWSNRIEVVLVAQAEVARLHSLVRSLQKIAAFDHDPPRLYGVHHLKEAFEILSTLPAGPLAYEKDPTVVPIGSGLPRRIDHVLPLSPRHQRLLGIAAAGAHHLLLIGPKGSGKTQMIEWLEALFPNAEHPEMLLQLALQELHADTTPHFTEAHLQRPIVRRVPPQVRPAALVGSMNAGLLRPGELALAHGGLLVADEFAEWPRDSREALRSPLEQGKVTLARAQYHLDYPADFTFAATANYCPCGGIPRDFMEAGRAGPECRCTYPEQQRYTSKLSGPILDRIDLVINVTGPHPDQNQGRGIEAMKDHVERTRKRARELWTQVPGKLSAHALEEILAKNPELLILLDEALMQPSSLRARHKILRVALSLALWDSAYEPTPRLPTARHFAEAALYRPERWTRTS